MTNWRDMSIVTFKTIAAIHSWCRTVKMSMLSWSLRGKKIAISMFLSLPSNWCSKGSLLSVVYRIAVVIQIILLSHTLGQWKSAWGRHDGDCGLRPAFCATCQVLWKDAIWVDIGVVTTTSGQGIVLLKLARGRATWCPDLGAQRQWQRIAAGAAVAGGLPPGSSQTKSRPCRMTRPNRLRSSKRLWQIQKRYTGKGIANQFM